MQLEKKQIMEDQILLCNNCGNTTSQSILYYTDSKDKIYNSNNPLETMEIESFYYLTKCKTCQSISLYTDNEYHDNIGVLSEAYICYPVVKRYDEYIPKEIAFTYNEAIKVEQISFFGFSCLIRKVLELICEDKVANGKNLKEKLKALKERKIIPDILYEMGDTLRILGNKSVHADYKIDVFEVNIMREFICAIIEYVYINPQKLSKVNSSLENKIR
mgnify:CR=1 FL=1